MDRVKWRSKEVYDAAYLMLNCVKKADYYLMMEDDVIAARGYVITKEKSFFHLRKLTLKQLFLLIQN